ncbi:hypothetical protein LS633_11935 [Pseudomonas sp. NIBR-H-19]|nr:hypothetical protein [Pseudomonas sp. NIBR-H-19]UHC84472.1 hypothetical protein LS633_11935 [Pseudomonas sp. NIBR-H-19]
MPNNEWLDTSAIDVVAVVDSHKAVAVYLIQSDYSLVRADGTPVTTTFSYTDGRSLHISQYTPGTPASTVAAAPEAQVPEVADIHETDNDSATPLAETALEEVTDTAP